MSQLLLAQINTILSVIYATDIQVCLPRSETLCTFQLAFYAATTWITASIKTLFVVGLMVCWFTWSWGKRRINGWIHSRWQRFWKFVKAFTDLIYFLWGPISQVGPFIYCFAICFFFICDIGRNYFLQTYGACFQDLTETYTCIWPPVIRYKHA